MQLTQKHISGIIISGLVLVGVYYAVQNTTPSKSDEVNISIGSIVPASKSDTGVETDTGKRLETLANSGTGWGISPFGSGKPLIEGEKKPEFKKPNTEWKTRTLSGITYVFGEGNPPEVVMTPTNLQEESRACALNPGSTSRICREDIYGYMTPEVEFALKKTLESPLWESLITECEKDYSHSSDFVRFQKNILAPHALDISRFLIIDPTTGRKELETLEIREIHLAIGAVGLNMYGSDIWENPCIAQYGKPLYHMLENVGVLYTSNVASAIQQNKLSSPWDIVSILNHWLDRQYFLINP